MQKNVFVLSIFGHRRDGRVAIAREHTSNGSVILRVINGIQRRVTCPVNNRPCNITRGELIRFSNRSCTATLFEVSIRTFFVTVRVHIWFQYHNGFL